MRYSNLLTLERLEIDPKWPLINYDRPLLRDSAFVVDIGDMGTSSAADTLDVSGLYLIPTAEALDESGGFNTGAPAHFTVAEDPQGRNVRFVFEGRMPEGR